MCVSLPKCIVSIVNLSLYNIIRKPPYTLPSPQIILLDPCLYTEICSRSPILRTKVLIYYSIRLLCNLFSLASLFDVFSYELTNAFHSHLQEF
uniref:Uncharacterized protein n=1 Tax=Mus musculus TaxID=10090 RepID=Q3TQD6_MOUSE|nr:unnamed protein product [Mus musculus]BAE37448.1 unnamed protein product [Mus musculus]